MLRLDPVGVKLPAGFSSYFNLARWATPTLHASYLTLALIELKTIEACAQFLPSCTFHQLVPWAVMDSTHDVNDICAYPYSPTLLRTSYPKDQTATITTLSFLCCASHFNPLLYYLRYLPLFHLFLFLPFFLLFFVLFPLLELDPDITGLRPY